MKNRDLKIFTDGGCEPNPGKGGWGFVVYTGDGKEVHSEFGGEVDSTNNRMEMTAMLRALIWLRSEKGCSYGKDIVVFSDSQYVVTGLTVWRHNWIKHGWKRGRKKKHDVKNVEIWKPLCQEFDAAEVDLLWVKGHAGNVGNERADKLATLGIVQKSIR